MRLRKLVLVMREHQVQAAAVDVEGAAEILGRHRRALKVPAGASWSPGRFPCWLARLGAFPQREITRIPLRAAAVGVPGRPHVLKPLARQGAVAFRGPDIEVDIPACRVGMAALDEPADEGDHFRHVPCRPWLDVRRQAAKRLVGAGECPLIPLGDRPPGDALALGGGQDLVVHRVAARPQPADEHVEVDARPDVADVRRRLDRRATQVQPDIPRRDRAKVTSATGGCIVQTERHAAQATG